MNIERWYPKYHIAPERGWLNDPNGLVYFKGQYHVFFQHHPDAPKWGLMHWGHVVSDDMVHWQPQPIALTPSEPYDQDGCFSGSALVKDDVLYLFYTGHVIVNDSVEPPIIRQVQCLATSEDGIKFHKQGIIIEPPEGYMHFRDPKVWQDAKDYKMILGAAHESRGAELLLYRSDDLHTWHFERIFWQTDRTDVYMFECPDLMFVDDHAVLMCSPQGMQAKGYDYRNLFQAGYWLGKYAAGVFTATTDFQEFDHGHDYYAPQSFVAADGRRIVIGWMDMWEANMPSAADGFAGVLTVPREIAINDAGLLTQNPIRELSMLRSEPTTRTHINLTNGMENLYLSTKSAEIICQIDLTQTTADKAGLYLAASGDFSEYAALYIDQSCGRLFLDLSRMASGSDDERSIPLPMGDALTLRILMDASSMEVFVNDGIAALSSRIYPNNSTRAMAAFANIGTLKITKLEHSVLKSMYA